MNENAKRLAEAFKEFCRARDEMEVAIEKLNECAAPKDWIEPITFDWWLADNTPSTEQIEEAIAEIQRGYDE